MSRFDAPTNQHGVALARAELLFVERAWVPHHICDDGTAVIKRIHHVKDVAGRRLAAWITEWVLDWRVRVRFLVCGETTRSCLLVIAILILQSGAAAFLG